MKKEIKRTAPINFRDFESFCFNPFIFDEQIYNFVGCGISLLSLLCGQNPVKIRKIYRRQKIEHSHPNHVSEKFLVEYLSKFYDVEEIAESDLLPETPTDAKVRLTKNHIILATQRFTQGELSYTASFRGVSWHNFLPFPLDYTEFLVRPAESLYILKKKEKPKRCRKQKVVDKIKI